MRKTYWISLRKLKVHEYFTTFRYLRDRECNWAKELEIAVRLQNRAQKVLSKACMGMLGYYLIISSLLNDNIISIKVNDLDISLPAAFMTSSFSVFYLINMFFLNNLIVTMMVRIQISLKFRSSGFSSDVYQSIIWEDENHAHSMPFVSNWFFESRIDINNFIGILIVICTAVLLVPLFSLGIYLINLQLTLLSDLVSIVEIIACIFGVGLISLAFVYFLCFHLPIPYKKNSDFIRYLFLPKVFPHKYK